MFAKTEGVTLAADVTEFDSVHSQVTKEVEKILMQKCDLPQPIIDLYMHMRNKWKLSTYSVGYLHGEHKQHSGQPATLFSNTFLAMMIMIIGLDEEEMEKGNYMMMAKGDDTVLKHRNHDKLKLNTNELTESVGAILTQDEDHAPQFINNFVTTFGLVPDVVRLAAKVKSFDSLEHGVQKLTARNLRTRDCYKPGNGKKYLRNQVSMRLT